MRATEPGKGWNGTDFKVGFGPVIWAPWVSDLSGELQYEESLVLD
jgi:hypothetical protein